MDKNLTAILLIIGNEILSGRTQDTNTSWIASKLAQKGIKLLEVRVIPDVKDTIIKTLHDVQSKATYIFTTGGIGPTHDDITTESVAAAFGVDAPVNDDARKVLLAHYGSEDLLTPARLKMARIPVGAKLVDNPASGAPGFHIGNVFVMAGVPRIMQAMLDGILPTLDSDLPYISNTVTCDLPESMIALELEDIQKAFPRVDVGSYPHFRMGEVSLSLVLRSPYNDDLHGATLRVIAMIRGHGTEPRAMSIMSVTN